MYGNENVHELNMVTNKIKVLDTFCEIIIEIYCDIINSRRLNMNMVHRLSFLCQERKPEKKYTIKNIKR